MEKFGFTREGFRKLNFPLGPQPIAALRKQWQDYAANIKPYPGRFSGRGIVICAGGISYLTCAWVNISMLRKNGCRLPIEVWYTGSELDEEVIGILAEMDVVCKNAKEYSILEVANYSIKPLAILNSSFREVLFLDADNVGVADPTYLFDDEHYKATGTIFWPDFWKTEKTNPIWQIVGSEQYDLIEQESGQLLINKERCWRELNLCWYFNLNREYYYQLLLGDKDTFKFAWLALGSPYSMVPTPVGFAGFREDTGQFHGLTMVQHDFSGRIIFLHRNWLKWDITLNGERVWWMVKRFRTDAVEKAFCFQHLQRGELKLKFWDLDGDVVYDLFDDLFGDFEAQCLNVLAKLREEEWYARFLVHAYLVRSRPGYSQGQTKEGFAPAFVAGAVKPVGLV